jgi:4-amino-4-deoxy-L-arabinose transferase-like glycosyltransferase
MSAGKDSTGFMADRNRLLIVGLIALTALGLYLRLRCLGCLGFRWDEDLTALTVKALSATGVPELPSGMIYIRFYPIQWIIASSVNAFGFSEFSLRLPSVLFGTALIPTGYWVASQLQSFA